MSQAAECAGVQGRFWEMHDRLFALRGKLGDVDFQVIAGEVGLDVSRFSKCVTTQPSARLRADMEIADALAIRGTPTFLIGNSLEDGRVSVVKIIKGAQSLEAFKRVLDELLR